MTFEEVRCLHEINIRISYINDPLNECKEKLTTTQGFKIILTCDTPGLGVFGNNDGLVKNYQDVKDCFNKYIQFILNPVNQCQRELQIFIPYSPDISKFYRLLLSVPDFVNEIKAKINEEFDIFIKVQDILEKFNARDSGGRFIPTVDELKISVNDKSIPLSNQTKL